MTTRKFNEAFAVHGFVVNQPCKISVCLLLVTHTLVPKRSNWWHMAKYSPSQSNWQQNQVNKNTNIRQTVPQTLGLSLRSWFKSQSFVWTLQALDLTTLYYTVVFCLICTLFCALTYPIWLFSFLSMHFKWFNKLCDWNILIFLRYVPAANNTKWLRKPGSIQVGPILTSWLWKVQADILTAWQS